MQLVCTSDGPPFREWLLGLDQVTQARRQARVLCFEDGNFQAQAYWREHLGGK